LALGLVRNEIFEGAIGSLMPEHFADSLHGRIYSSALALIARGVKANPVTLGSEFDRDSALTERGGARYLTRLASCMRSKSLGRALG